MVREDMLPRQFFVQSRVDEMEMIDGNSWR
jgi:hypothetical protein